jgi:hypothetical protein
MAGGRQIVAAAKWGGERLLNLIAAEGATHIFVPSPVLTEFTDVAKIRSKSWRSLPSALRATSRGEPTILVRLAYAIETRYLAGWGMTELSGGLTAETSRVAVLDRSPNIFLLWVRRGPVP